VFEALKAIVLRLAKVPPEPHAPAGSPGSIRIFRAAPNYWKYVLVMWALTQAVFVVPLVALAAAAIQTRSPGVRAIMVLAAAVFAIQFIVSIAAARLDFEMRWYIVTDRSLRIREGIFGVREMTLTYANVQNIAISQGPLQRLLGIADVVVRTAGGGAAAGGHESRGAGASMHSGVLRAVDNAEQVRDLILDRLRHLRDAGLGDPDDRHQHDGSGASSLRSAATDLLAAARALRG